MKKKPIANMAQWHGGLNNRRMLKKAVQQGRSR